LPGFYFGFWQALWVPKGAPKEIIARLNAAAVETLADPTVRQRFAELGQDILSPDRLTPEALVPSTRPRSSGGGRSSRRRTSRRNERPLSGLVS
jgi:hypothetical protein